MDFKLPPAVTSSPPCPGEQPDQPGEHQEAERRHNTGERRQSARERQAGHRGSFGQHSRGSSSRQSTLGRRSIRQSDINNQEEVRSFSIYIMSKN